jgi:hypothetical protein
MTEEMEFRSEDRPQWTAVSDCIAWRGTVACAEAEARGVRQGPCAGGDDGLAADCADAITGEACTAFGNLGTVDLRNLPRIKHHR